MKDNETVELLVVLHFNVANSNKSDNLAISCQWQVLTESYLMT